MTDKPVVPAKQVKTVNTGIAIKENPPKGDDMAFTHSILCQVGLPRSKVDAASL